MDDPRRGSLRATAKLTLRDAAGRRATATAAIRLREGTSAQAEHAAAAGQRPQRIC